MTERWPAPTNPVAFESLCADLWGSIWGQPAQKNGRNGQAQAGVDIYGRHEDKWIGIQCKQKDDLLRSHVTPSELVKEVEAARSFVPPISRFILATTGPSDTAIQETARRLTEEHVQQGLFEVEVWSWPEIWAELNRRPALLTVIGPLYWPQIFLASTERSNREQTEQLLQALQLPLLPCGLYLTLKIEATDEDLRRVYGDQAGFHNVPRPLSSTDGRHFLGECYLDVTSGLVKAAGFFRIKHAGYNIFHRDITHTVARFDRTRSKPPPFENEPLFFPPHVTLQWYRGGKPRSTGTSPTLTLTSTLAPAKFVGSCALDNTVLVDYEYPLLASSPSDATGFSITSLRGSFVTLTLDFFYLKPFAWLPEQSWPHIHNLQVLLGSQRHALTFSLGDLGQQLTRANPNPIARGDAVMPQIVFECEIEAASFERHVIDVVLDRAHASEQAQSFSASGFPVRLSKSTGRDMSRSPQREAVCKLCQQPTNIGFRAVLPEYLFPEHPQIQKEQLLCTSCADKLTPWDEYGERLMRALPEDTSESEGQGLVYNVDYGQLRLWLLSLLWRMAVAQGEAWRAVELGTNEAEEVRGLLARANPGSPGQYPVGCVLPSFDGQHLDFSFQPDCIQQPNGSLVRAAFRGVLFFFGIIQNAKDEDLDSFFLRAEKNWIVPVVKWNDIDFLRHWIETLRENRDSGMSA